MREWQYLTGADFEAMDRAKTVVMVSCSPLEVHGPHLPVITDNHEAEGLSLRVMELMSERMDDIEFVHLPPIYVATDVLPHPGSVAFRPSTIVRVLEDLGRSLARQGFRHLWVNSFHGGPRHFLSIEMAADRVWKRYGLNMISVFSLMITKLTDGSSDLKHVLGELEGLSADALEGDTHGGTVETSMMLHLLGDRVKPHEHLPRVTVDRDLADVGKPPLRQGANVLETIRAFKELLHFFARRTYAGDPSIASAEKGKHMVEVLAGESASALEDAYRGRLSPDDAHSPLWGLRHVLTQPLLGAAFERAIGFKNPIF